MSRQEAIDQYARALKAGRKCYKDCTARGEPSYPAVLDELLEGVAVAGQMDVGLVEVPSELIAGTKSEGRRSAFAANFMPLMDESSEFALKWIGLCAAHLGDEGIRDPIRCYEYLGRFYVQEGNKRASVLKSYGAPTVPGYVVRVLPIWSEDPEIRAYYDFMQSYELSGLYRVRFSRPGSFAKLQAALGHPADHVWTEDERQRFSSGLFYFHEAFCKLGGPALPITEADALLVWLKVYPLENLRGFSTAELLRSLEAVWPDIRALAQGDPVSVATEPEDAPETTDAEALAKAGDGPEPKLLDRLLGRTPGKLRIAFVNQYTPEESDWIRSHDLGRQYLEAMLGAKVDLRSYDGVGAGEGAEAAMEQAVAEGAQVIFATTPPLIAACRKTAAQHPGVRVLNCSAAMPCTGVRSYYTRIYEGKFITGALAGALCRDGRIGYVADSPIFGVPAGINAFALGAQLTNPSARVYVRWFCVENALQKLVNDGFSYISNRDVPSPDRQGEAWGLCRCDGRRVLHSLASPYWHWGNFYVKLVRSILDGGWDALGGRQEGRAVSYWWGLRSRTTDVLLSEELPASARQLVEILRQGLASGTLSPFQRPLRAQDGSVRSDGSAWFTPEAILQMDWLCEGVEGQIPRFEELLPVSRRLVRLQGVYRDSIPPEKEETVLWKLLLLSDKESPYLWDYYQPGRLNGYDLMISCGDLSASYLSFLVTLGRAPLLYVPGNHDVKYQNAPPEGCDCIDGRLVTVKGLRILGLGGSIRYSGPTYQYTERQMARRIRRLHSALRRAGGVDLLVTHSPAEGWGDDEDYAHRGFACFLPLLDEYKPRYFIHGHVHANYGAGRPRVLQRGGTTIINAYERYELEIPDETLSPPPPPKRRFGLW